MKLRDILFLFICLPQTCYSWLAVLLYSACGKRRPLYYREGLLVSEKPEGVRWSHDLLGPGTLLSHPPVDKKFRHEREHTLQIRSLTVGCLMLGLAG